MPLINKTDIPAGARLELRWSRGTERNEFICLYLLLVPLQAHDLRRADPDCENDMLRIVLGAMTDRPKSPLGQEVTLIRNDSISLPYRDSHHATWDAMHLGNLPVWVTFEDKAMLHVVS